MVERLAGHQPARSRGREPRPATLPLKAASGTVLRLWLAARKRRSISGMSLVRALLSVGVALLFVMTVSLVFFRDTGLVEKLVLVGVAVLLAVLVPRIQAIARPTPR